MQSARSLRFVELGGKGLASLEATAEIPHGGLPYDVAQVWSKALHDHLIGADGIAYHGRHDDHELCYAIFSRTAGSISKIDRRLGLNADWFWELAESYGTGLAPG